MKLKGKLVQIIPEEKRKSYGLKEYKNCDYLNIRPFLERNPNKNLKYVFYGITFIGILISILFNNLLPFVIAIVIVIFIAAITDSYMYKYTKNKYWYFDKPLPILKPHKFKVDDIITLNLSLKKEKK